MARRGLLVVPVCVIAVCAVLAGCGGGGSSSGGSGGASTSSSNGEAKKPAKQIVADAKTAARGAGSFRIKGSISSGGQTIALNLLVGRAGGNGTMTFQGSKIDIIRTGKNVYLRTGAAFYRKIGAAKGAASALAGKWLKASTSTKSFGDLAQFTDIDKLVEQALSPNGKVTKGAETTVDGQKAIELKSKEGSLFVATEGAPYPVQLRGNKGTLSGAMHFSDFGAPVDTTAPQNAIDVAKLANG
ncbi:MAG TPA: hypothetical protein VFA56_08360 [Gaiellaceae bacterium]|nr:hypothetical protein [Gaiellaceae bacterium]